MIPKIKNLQLIDILISETETYNCAYMYAVTRFEVEVLKKLISDSNKILFLKIYRNFSQDDESNFDYIIKRHLK